MTDPTPTRVFAGIDTHADTHHVALIDHDGRPLADQQFTTDPAGLDHLAQFLTRHGQPLRIGIEGTNSYGKPLTHLLHADGHTLVEVNRPDRHQRRQHGKSDPTDAYAAAHAVRTNRATTPPKLTTGAIEGLRLTKMTRASAVHSRTQTINEIRATLRTGPTELAHYNKLTLRAMITTLAKLRHNPTGDATMNHTKAALTTLARRWQHLTDEITTADKTITTIVNDIAPELIAVDCVGPHTAAQLLITAGSNPDRLTTEAQFARLTGVAPIPASSGKTRRHRLHRGGDRQANNALWRIAFNRRQHHPATRAYYQRRQQHLTDREILRCLKRYIARELFPILTMIINREHTKNAH
ncbi:MAG TPA: IS110 family transposase [Propionibacteriaceae bacterium]